MAKRPFVEMPTSETALPGRAASMVTEADHFVSGRPLDGPLPANHEVSIFAMGCFWGVERLFWKAPGVWVTGVGYAGGFTPNATYEEVCTGLTGHAEVVRIVHEIGEFPALLKLFWENHDPTQATGQGEDIGTQYRSAIYYLTETQKIEAERSRDHYQTELTKAGKGRITTEILPAGPFYFAEGYHQGYLAKNPAGYCGLRGTGVTCDLRSIR